MTALLGVQRDTNKPSVSQHECFARLEETSGCAGERAFGEGKCVRSRTVPDAGCRAIALYILGYFFDTEMT
jgi:hypothetical protein